MAATGGGCSRAPVMGHATLSAAAQCPECAPKMRAAAGLPNLPPPTRAHVVARTMKGGALALPGLYQGDISVGGLEKVVKESSDPEEILAAVEIAQSQGGVAGNHKGTLVAAAANPATPVILLGELIETHIDNRDFGESKIVEAALNNPSLPTGYALELMRGPGAPLGLIAQIGQRSDIDPVEWSNTMVAHPDLDSGMLSHLARHPATTDSVLDEVCTRALDLAVTKSDTAPIRTLCDRNELPPGTFARIADFVLPRARAMRPTPSGVPDDYSAVLAVATSAHASDALVEELVPYLVRIEPSGQLAEIKEFARRCLRRESLSSDTVEALAGWHSPLWAHPGLSSAALDRRVNETEYSTKSTPASEMWAIMRNPNLSDEKFRGYLIRAEHAKDAKSLAALAEGPNLSSDRVQRLFDASQSGAVRAVLAKQPNLPEAVIVALGKSRDADVASALVENPTVPLRTVGRILSGPVRENTFVRQAAGRRMRGHLTTIGVSKENTAAHEYFEKLAWWELDAESREVAIGMAIHLNP